MCFVPSLPRPPVSCPLLLGACVAHEAAWAWTRSRKPRSLSLFYFASCPHDLATPPPFSFAQRALSMMEPWIESSEPFILVGPEGCGKDMIIRHAFSSESAASRGGVRGTAGGGGGGGSGAKRLKTSITVLHCNARTTAEHVITKVKIQPFLHVCVCVGVRIAPEAAPHQSVRALSFGTPPFRSCFFEPTSSQENQPG